MDPDTDAGAIGAAELDVGTGAKAEVVGVPGVSAETGAPAAPARLAGVDTRPLCRGAS